MTATIQTYVNQLTLTTGNMRRCERSEVSDKDVANLQRWLAALILAGEGPLHGNLSDYSAKATAHNGSLMLSVFGKSRPGQGKTPILTMGVAARSRQSHGLWKIMSTFGRSGQAEPEGQWSCVMLHASLAADPAARVWLGDFGKCASWAWLERT